MYNKYFGFVESPFSVTPDPRFFYTNPLYQEALAILHYGIEAKKGFIVISGEVGTGKTTLLRKLLRNLAGTIHSVFIFNTHIDFTGLLQLILRDLGLATQEKDKLTMIEELNHYLIEQVNKGHIVSVLIDEAQNLSIEALEGLRLLSNLETDKEKLLQIVLMGQPELERKLDQPNLRQLKQRVALHCQLAPLKEKEVGPYIDFRLGAAGYGGEDLFDPGAVEQIAFYSKGIPRLINIICDNALLNVYGTSQKRVVKEMINEVADDLRLKVQPEFVNVTVRAIQAPATNPKQEARQPAPANRLPSRSNRVARVRIGSLFALLLLAVGTAFWIINLKNFFVALFEHPKAEARLEASSPRSPETIEGANASTFEHPKAGAKLEASSLPSPETIEGANASTKDLLPNEEPQGVNISPKRNPPPTPPRRAKGREYTIKANDSLSQLAERYYGSQWRWREIYVANRESIENPDYIYIGQTIIIPGNTLTSYQNARQVEWWRESPLQQ
jgi:general secretion pathway protein A